MTQYLVKVMAFLMLACFPASADLIGTWTVSENFGGLAGIRDEVVITFSADAESGHPDTLFDNVIWTAGDAGKTVSLMSIADDPNFEKATQALTNGVDEFVGINVETFPSPPAVGAGTATLESNAFGTTPDFVGFQIDAIALTVNSLSITSPAPGFPPDSTAGSVDMTVNIYGSPNAIPEPSTRALACLAFVLLISARRVFPRFL